jgi:hypothetical protein
MGVEDFSVGIGKMALSYLSGARPDIVTENGNLTKSNIDVRFYDLKGPAGLWAGWFELSPLPDQPGCGNRHGHDGFGSG